MAQSDKKYTDCMIDVETLSTRTNAIVFQLAWVFFDQDGAEEDLEGFSLLLDIEEQEKMGRHRCYKTEGFWASQDQKLFKELTSGEVKVFDAINSLRSTWETYAAKGCRVWGNGSSFDETLVRSLYEVYDEDTPWVFWKARDFRTRMEDTPGVTRVKSQVAHDGLEDAKAQAISIIRTRNNLGVENE